MTFPSSNLTPGITHLVARLAQGAQESTSLRLKVVVHAFNVRTWETEEGWRQESNPLKPEPCRDR